MFSAFSQNKKRDFGFYVVLALLCDTSVTYRRKATESWKNLSKAWQVTTRAITYKFQILIMSIIRITGYSELGTSLKMRKISKSQIFSLSRNECEDFSLHDLNENENHEEQSPSLPKRFCPTLLCVFLVWNVSEHSLTPTLDWEGVEATNSSLWKGFLELES